MLPENNSHTDRFRKLLAEVESEITSLKKEVRSLKRRNEQLEEELNEAKAKEADVFSSVKETERMSLKHQVKGLISKIDEHLEGKHEVD